MAKIFTDKKEDYMQTKQGMLTADSDRWFYRRLGIDCKKGAEESVRDYMERLRAQKKVEAVNGKTLYPAAVPFSDLLPEIREDTLFEIFQKMPKGGLLHVHSAAGLSTDGFLKLLKDWCGKITEGSDEEILYVENVPENEKRYSEGMLMYRYQSAKVPENVELRPLKELLWASGGSEWLRKKLSFCDRESVSKIDIWGEFNIIFARIDKLYYHKEFYVDYHAAFFKECLNDRIDYVELRSGLQEFEEPDLKEADGFVYADGHPKYQISRHLYYRELMQEIQVTEPPVDFLQAMLEAKDQADPDKKLKLKVILNARRNLDPNVPAQLQKLSRKTDAAIYIKEKCAEKFQKLMLGFDYVSEEDRGKDTALYAETIMFQPFGAGYEPQRKDTRPRIQRIDFFLHDGESCWKGNGNVMDAALLSRHRIGHGFQMNWHPDLLKTITDQDEDTDSHLIEPVLEICPISNQILRYYQDIRNHSAYELMKSGICCVISSDDPLLFGSVGLSYDFWEAYVGMELPYEAVKACVYVSYLYRGYLYGEESFADARARFEQEWSRFIEEIEVPEEGRERGQEDER